MTVPDFRCVHGCSLAVPKKQGEYKYVRTPEGIIYCIKHWKELLK